MTPENFVFWLNGFAELTRGQAPTAGQWQSIVEHLALVFGKVTPPVLPEAVGDELDRLRKAAEAAKPVPEQDRPGGMSVEDAIRRMQDAWAERERNESMRYPGGVGYIGTGLGLPIVTC